MVYILIYILIYTFNIKEVRLYINLYIKKEDVFLLLNDDLYSIYTFQIKLNQEFLLFFKLLKKHSIQYFTVEQEKPLASSLCE